jgi:hypothetical protein
MFKWFSIVIIAVVAISAIVQIASITVISNRCAKAGHSMACIGSVCRCVDEVRRSE